MNRRDTIFALSTGRGRAGIAVVRVSGPETRLSIKFLANKEALEARKAVRVPIRSLKSGEMIDDGLVLWFPGPGSFTGEDLAEFHVHGGMAVVNGVLDALASLSGFRPAEPGEFTRRAFLNGKMDLTAAEGLADLVDAETAAQRRQALRQLSGDLGRRFDEWRSSIVRSLAHLEAYIDFPDEELPSDLSSTIRDSVRGLRDAISSELDDGRRGERLREGVLITILGAPNVGKSSIVNVLSKRQAAIVAAEAGTTRDVVEVHLDLGGFPVVLADTAGIRETENIVEKEGVRRALAHARQADIKLVVADATHWGQTAEPAPVALDQDSVLVLNKADLLPSSRAMPEIGCRVPGRIVLVSALTGQGIDELVSVIESEVASRLSTGETATITRARHRLALEDCRASLDRFLMSRLPELAADDLRHAADALGRITGRIGVEELLDVIFRDFCLGK